MIFHVAAGHINMTAPTFVLTKPRLAFLEQFLRHPDVVMHVHISQSEQEATFVPFLKGEKNAEAGIVVCKENIIDPLIWGCVPKGAGSGYEYGSLLELDLDWLVRLLNVLVDENRAPDLVQISYQQQISVLKQSLNVPNMHMLPASMGPNQWALMNQPLITHHVTTFGTSNVNALPPTVFGGGTAGLPPTQGSGPFGQIKTWLGLNQEEDDDNNTSSLTPTP
jgi:hypothetical protein